MYTKLWPENLKGRDHLGDPGIDGWTILKWNLKKQGVILWNGRNWLRRFLLSIIMMMMMMMMIIIIIIIIIIRVYRQD
jgi:hypothetical protein